MSRLKLIPWHLLPSPKNWWSPTFGFNGCNHFTLDWGSSKYSYCCCFCPPVSCPYTSGSVGVDGLIDLLRCNECEIASTFQINIISPTSDTKNRSENLFLVKGANCHVGDGKLLMFWQCSSSAGKIVGKSLTLRRKLQRFWRRWGMSAGKATCFRW